ncbi:hypothetical protein [Sphaerisporangium sp. TRM90804]|uniref:hypothetical protein n=1 Tax=Sphaerisporangium sp. TRM90804 TaxID=3031113 RepID=UPI00244B53B9|nr:hypothetical protein [Sphaerisporangium sp. TRM90804]MDH2426960.1 hypothetical protein [Sphaerisporangium sp. TRM90804]
MTPTPPTARRRRAVLVPVLAVLAAVALGAGAAFGGLEEAPKEQPRRLGKGATLDQGQMSTRFVDAVVRPGGEGAPGVPGKRYLQLHLRVTNQDSRTISAQAMDRALPTVRTDGKVFKTLQDSRTVGVSPHIVVKDADPDHYYSQLPPGVPTDVILSFEMPPGRAAPKTVQIDAVSFEWRESFFWRTHSWSVVSEPAPQPAAGPGANAAATRYVPVVAARVELPAREETA